jgi:O-antigen/teichoic acid export membrane protein
MLTRIRRYIQSPASLTFAGRGIQYSSQMVMALVIPKVLAPAVFVQLSLVLPLAYLGASLLFSWLTGALHRYVFELLEPENSDTRRTAVFYYGIVSFALLTLFLALSAVTDTIYRLVPLLLIAAAFRDLVLGILNTSGHHKGYFLANLGFAASLTVFVAICFSHDVQLGPYLTLYAGIDIAVALIASRFLGLLDVEAGCLDSGVLARYFRYGIPLLANSLAIWVMSVSDRYLLALWTPKEVVAGYVLSYQLGGSIIMVPMSFAVAIALPNILRIDKERGEAEALAYCYRLLNYYRKSMIVVFALACAIVLPLKHYVYPAYEFDPAVLVVIVFAHVVYSLIHFYNKEFELNGRTVVITRAMALGAVVNVAFNLVLIPCLGALGAAVGTLLAYTSTVQSVFRAGHYRAKAV